METLFFLFAWNDYYPSGGVGDFVAAYPTIEHAKAAYARNDDDMQLDTAEIAIFRNGMLIAIERGESVRSDRRPDPSNPLKMIGGFLPKPWCVKWKTIPTEAGNIEVSSSEFKALMDL